MEPMTATVKVGSVTVLPFRSIPWITIWAIAPIALLELILAVNEATRERTEYWDYEDFPPLPLRAFKIGMNNESEQLHRLELQLLLDHLRAAAASDPKTMSERITATLALPANCFLRFDEFSEYWERRYRPWHRDEERIYRDAYERFVKPTGEEKLPMTLRPLVPSELDGQLWTGATLEQPVKPIPGERVLEKVVKRYLKRSPETTGAQLPRAAELLRKLAEREKAVTGQIKTFAISSTTLRGRLNEMGYAFSSGRPNRTLVWGQVLADIAAEIDAGDFT